MRQHVFMDKYPVFTLSLDKSETSMGSVDDIVATLKARIEETPKVSFIAVFDHLAHTRSIGGEVNPRIVDAKNIVFCFGHALPNPMVMAVRPRSIGVCDMGDTFELSFLEAPMPPANIAMEGWVKALRDR